MHVNCVPVYYMYVCIYGCVYEAKGYGCVRRHILTEILAAFELDAKADGAPVYRVWQDAQLRGEDRRDQLARHHRRRVDVARQDLQQAKTRWLVRHSVRERGGSVVAHKERGAVACV